MDRMCHEDVALFTKRIDSTLRGNVGMEMKAMLDRLPGHMAVVVASFPASGRVCIGGYLLVNQVPLENTDVGKDPKTPVRHSKVETIIADQYGGRITSIHLNCVLKGWEHIREDLHKASMDGVRVVVVDATTEEDIQNIAKAVKASGIKAIAVDPGPFTAALAKEIMGQPGLTPGKKILLSIGSVNLTRRQIEKLRMKYDPLIYHVDTLSLLNEASLAAETEKALDALLGKMDDYEIVGITTTTSEDQVLNLKEVAREYNTSEEEISNRISDGLAKITRRLLEASSSRSADSHQRRRCHGGRLQKLNSSGIVVKGVALAVYGRILRVSMTIIPSSPRWTGRRRRCTHPERGVLLTQISQSINLKTKNQKHKKRMSAK